MVDLTAHWAGVASLVIFVIAYTAVVLEEHIHLRKSTPVLAGAGLIWVLIGLAYLQLGNTDGAADAFRHNLLDFAELFLFLITAMTYVNTLEERGVFDTVRVWLLNRGLSYRALFWVTGGMSFALSPIADNLTTALVMGAVVITMGANNPKFIALACINVVVAANAGGAFSPFGDITTLMVWQKELVSFTGFIPLFIPSVVNWLVPAAIMARGIERGRPAVSRSRARMEAGTRAVVVLFICTIAITVTLHSFLHLPPAGGMMLGLGILKLYSYFFNLRSQPRRLTINELDDVFGHSSPHTDSVVDEDEVLPETSAPIAGDRAAKPMHIFRMLERVEWDTLMFFYGVILAVGGLGTLGYLGLMSRGLYDGLGATAANILVGLLSAVVDNVPIMFAVLSMNPTMSQGQWLLVTLTAGVGGSLLSVGSAAGVALMGQSRGAYTFMSHLRWTWAIALGYVASIVVHVVLNGHLF